MSPAVPPFKTFSLTRSNTGRLFRAERTSPPQKLMSVEGAVALDGPPLHLQSVPLGLGNRRNPHVPDEPQPFSLVDQEGFSKTFCFWLE